HAYTSQGFLVAEIILVRIMPLEDFFHHGEPALVIRFRVDLGEGWTEILRYAVGHPEPDFVAALHGILPAILIFQADAEDTRDGFASERGTKFFCAFAGGPGGSQACAALAIREQGGRHLSDGLHIQLAQRAATGVGDVACVGIDLLYL